MSTAIGAMSREGKVLRTDEGWLLPGRPPGELVELAGAAAEGPGPGAGEASSLKTAFEPVGEARVKAGE